MSRVFHRKKFSDYLGEQRAIDDIITFYIPDPIPPTPSPTPVPATPTPTPSVTPTVTPSPQVFYSGLFFTGNTNVDACNQINPSVTLYSTSPFYTYYQQVFTQPTNNSAYWIPFGLFLASGSTSYEYQYIGFAPGLVDLGACPSPTPTPTNTPVTPTPTPTRTPAPACDITYTELPSPTPSPTPTITPTNTSSPTPTLTPTPSPGPSFDPDAAAYLSAVVSAGGTTNPTISAATNTLFTDLKSAGLYGKTTMMYPYIGSSSSSHSLEGKNPGTNNISFNVVAGSWIHNLSGATPGTQCWATNNVYLNTASTLNNVSLFTYLGTDNSFGGDYCIDFGTTDDLGLNGVNGLIGGSSQPDTTSYFYNNDGSATRITISSASIPNGLGFFGYNRTTSTNFNVWRNGVKVGTNTNTNIGVLPSLNPLYMPAPNNAIIYVNKWTTRRHQFDWVGQGLSDVDALTLSTIINTFQTSLGRNTY